MANTGNRIGDFTDEVEEATNEVAQDVKDSIGEMIEQGVQSVLGSHLTPQQINNPTASEQQREVEEQKKLAKIRKTIKWYQDISAAQKKVRDEEKQKKLLLKQEEEEEKRRKKQQEEEKKKIIISPARKTSGPGQPPLREDIALSRPELKGGHGKGG